MSDFAIRNPDQVLVPPSPRAVELGIQIGTLREALECAAAGDAAAIYGRIDSLINTRQDELVGIYRRAATARGPA